MTRSAESCDVPCAFFPGMVSSAPKKAYVVGKNAVVLRVSSGSRGHQGQPAIRVAVLTVCTPSFLMNAAVHRKDLAKIRLRSNSGKYKLTLCMAANILLE